MKHTGRIKLVFLYKIIVIYGFSFEVISIFSRVLCMTLHLVISPVQSVVTTWFMGWNLDQPHVRQAPYPEYYFSSGQKFVFSLFTCWRPAWYKVKLLYFKPVSLTKLFQIINILYLEFIIQLKTKQK